MKLVFTYDSFRTLFTFSNALIDCKFDLQTNYWISCCVWALVRVDVISIWAPEEPEYIDHYFKEIIDLEVQDVN